MSPVVWCWSVNEAHSNECHCHLGDQLILSTGAESAFNCVNLPALSAPHKWRGRAAQQLACKTGREILVNYCHHFEKSFAQAQMCPPSALAWPTLSQQVAAQIAQQMPRGAGENMKNAQLLGCKGPKCTSAPSAAYRVVCAINHVFVLYKHVNWVGSIVELMVYGSLTTFKAGFKGNVELCNMKEYLLPSTTT